VRWPWKRRGITRAEAQKSRAHLAHVDAREALVDHTLAQRRATKNRNGFGPLFEEGFTRR